VNRDKIELFWSYFKEHQESYANFEKDYERHPLETAEKVDQLIQELQKVSKGLFITLKPKEIIITAKGKKEYFGDAFEVVNNAPTFDGWKIVATKPSYGLDFDFDLTGVQINPNTLTFMPLEAPQYPNDIAIRIFHKDYTQEQSERQNAVVVGAYAGLDIMFGEIDSQLNFQYIDFDDMPHPKEKDFPFSRLSDYVKLKKEKRPNSGVEFPRDDVVPMEGKIDGLPSLLILNKSLDYYEYTYEFPYLLALTLTLKNIGENGLPQGNVDELYLIENIIYQEISKEKNGHFIATETYNGKRNLFYYAKREESLEKALDMLPIEYDSCEIDYSINYDPFWAKTDRFRA